MLCRRELDQATLAGTDVAVMIAIADLIRCNRKSSCSSKHIQEIHTFQLDITFQEVKFFERKPSSAKQKLTLLGSGRVLPGFFKQASNCWHLSPTIFQTMKWQAHQRIPRKSRLKGGGAQLPWLTFLLAQTLANQLFIAGEQC